MFKFFSFLTEVIGWLAIVASPFLIGIVIGAVVYFNNPGTTGIVIGISIAVLGLIIGIIWATRVWRKKGTLEFISIISATPELDVKEEEEIK
ncbi:MAG: hypothetical protein M3R17_21505 [Bacteroidota bacterium]|nr:hypothetical protein [Bacteroidota bacterium]